MGFWALAAPAIASGVLGGIGGKKKAKQSNKPTRNVVLPPSQLGGWSRLQEILKSMQGAPQYRVGENNPYLSGGMSHLMGRAGIPTPESGYGTNPYLGAGGAPAPTPPPPVDPGKVQRQEAKHKRQMERMP